MAVEIVVNVLFDEVADVFVHVHAGEREGISVRVFLGRHHGGVELNLRLTLEHWFDDAHGDGAHQAVAHVLNVEVLPEIFLYGACDVLLERTLMRPALRGVLAVDEGVVFLAVLRRVGEGDVYAVARQVDDGVERRRRHVVVQKVFKSAA